MKNTTTTLVCLFAFLFSTNVYSQNYSSCPNVLDESIQLYQPSYADVACEYDTYGKCIQSFAKVPLLSEQLQYFDTRFRTHGVELVWQSKKFGTNESFQILRSKDGQQFQKIGEVNSADFADGQFSFLDNLPNLGNNHYLLKKTTGQKTLVSNQQSVYVSIGLCHLETVDIKKQKDLISMKYHLDASGVFQLLVTDTEGHEQARKDIAVRPGKNDVEIDLPFNGIYFVTLTNGFSSVTDLVVQSQGSMSQKTAVAENK